MGRCFIKVFPFVYLDENHLDGVGKESGLSQGRVSGAGRGGGGGGGWGRSDGSSRDGPNRDQHGEPSERCAYKFLGNVD